MRLLLRRVLRRRAVSRQRPPIDTERLERIYRETHRRVEELRRAA